MTQKPKKNSAAATNGSNGTRTDIQTMKRAMKTELLPLSETRSRRAKAPPAPIRRKTESSIQAPAPSLQTTLPKTAKPVVPPSKSAIVPKPGRAPAVGPRSSAPSTRSSVVSSTGDENAPLRLSKLMTLRGLCSRREADEFIARGLVKVDGKIVDQLGSKVLPSAEIELHPDAKVELENLVTILLNKPIGYVSSQPELGYDPAVILITPENQYAKPGDANLKKSHFDGLAPAGRLDIDSQGLLVFTQNGKIAKALIGDESDVEKEYLVRVSGSLDTKGLKLLNHGLELDGVKLRPALVEWLNEDQLRFVLKEGRKRQIRRMCELVGLKVVGLKRVRIGRVRLGRLPEGQWRFLEPDEMF